VVRGRFLALDLLAAAVWAAALVVALAGLGDLLASVTALDQARGAAAGSILAALVVLGAAMTAPGPVGGTAEPATAGRGIP
jgi:membrane protein DedA with SNARE-associated domain